MSEVPQRLDLYVTAAYRQSRGLNFDRRYEDAASALIADPALLAEAQSEVVRLTDTRGKRVLGEHDYEGTVRLQTLQKMLAAYATRETP